MVLPVNVATCTVTAAFVKLDGTPAAGTVTFTPVPARLLDATADPPTTILGTPIVATLDENGALDVDLPATDDTDLNPVDWAYHVSVRLGADTAYSFCMEAPAGSVDLTEVTPIIGTEGDAITTGPRGPQGETGVGVPTGGDTGYILVKASAADYDMTWATAPPPGPHAASHAAAGIDPVTVEQSQVTGLVAGLAAKQPLDSDLTTIAALSPGSDAVIQRKVGMWVASTPTEYKTDLDLTKSDVGLGNVTNTSDAAKPVSTAQQTALDLKADKSTTITPTAPLSGGGSLAANRTLTVATFGTAAAGVVPASGGGTANYLRADGTWASPGGGGITAEDAVDAVATALTEGTGIDLAYDDGAGTITVTVDKTEMSLTKSDVGLSNVDNTADASKPLFSTTTTTPGIVPGSNSVGTGSFLRADGTWALPPGAGGTVGHSTYTHNATLTEPPATGQLRFNNATQPSATKVWVSQIDEDGLDVSIGLAKILAGHQIYIQDYDNAANWIKYNVTAVSDDGAYYDFTVTYHSGPGGIPAGSGAAGRVEFQPVAPGTVGVPPGGTSGQALTKSSSADYAVAWTSVLTDVVHVGTAAPSDAAVELWWDTDEPAVGVGVRTINTYSGTSLTAVIGDAGAYIRCTGTNPTYTIPLNSSVAFVVGTQIDGVGTATAMTIAATGGVTVNKARTLVTVAADSGWTAIKVATNEWDVHGDFV